MKLVATYQYIEIKTTETPPAGRKTRTYFILNRRTGCEIGRIKWLPQWRQFCFFPDQYSVWSNDCLVAVVLAIGKVKAHHEGAKHGGNDQE